MSGATIDIRIKLNFPVILITVLALHALLISLKHMERTQLTHNNIQDHLRPIRVSRIETNTPRIRTVGAKDSLNKTSTYLSKNNSKAKTISKDVLVHSSSSHAVSNVVREQKKDISFKDLTENAPLQKMAKAQNTEQVRPGTRPGVFPPRPKAINAISLKGNQIQQFAQASDAMALSGDSRGNPSLSNSDILVNLEVPEGVNPDELNKYELMFYSFQRRTAIGYINSFFKHLDKFERENPHKRFPLTDAKQVMTGRLTYDEKGNIKQIKMIRWTNVQELQNFFEDVLKDMDTLHNPPTALWERDGEFSIFFSLVVNG